MNSRHEYWRSRTNVDIQIGLILEEFGADNIGIARVDDDPAGEPDYLYQRERILVRDEYLERVANELDRGGVPEEGGGLVAGVSLYILPREDPQRPDERDEVQTALSQIDEQVSTGIASPDHIVSITPGGHCPATEPEAPRYPRDPAPDPPVSRDVDAGRGVYIYVADTGLLPNTEDHPWLVGVRGKPDPRSPQRRQLIPPYAGHGTFVAGVARCMAPAVDIYVDDVFDKAGAKLESDAAMRIDEALDSGPDIIVLPGGGTTRQGRPHLTFQAFWENSLRHFKGVAFVVSAGNCGNRKPFWPAPFPWAVSVGALDTSRRRRAEFSNYGGSVDVYAPGTGIVNAYAVGTYQYQEAPKIGETSRFRGMARWSGTSFSAPVVAGLIAARMSTTGENGRRAAEALLAQAREQAVPYVGPVLLPADC
jgi:subtilisin family serine protease